MGIIGSLKNKFLGRRDELGDIRSHVLGEESYDRDYPEPRMDRDYPEPRMDIDDRVGPREIPEMPEPFPRDDVGRFSSPEERFGREPIALEESAARSENKNYEIMDRLNIIEAQLTAIRSQTETINERLKNLEMKLGRRY